MCDISSTAPTLVLRERFPSSEPLDQVQQSQSRTIMQTELSVNPKNRIRRRRKLESAIFFALTISALVLCPTASHAFTGDNRPGMSQRRNEWKGQSAQYDSSIMVGNAGTAQSQQKTQIDSTPSKSELPSLSNQGHNVIIVHHDGIAYVTHRQHQSDLNFFS